MVIFSREEEFYAGDGPFLAWNFQTLAKTLYTAVQLNLDLGKAYDPMMRFFREQWAKFFFWFLILLAYKFLLPGFLIGALTKHYMLSYDSYVEYILRFPKLTKIIKSEIY